MSSLNTYSRQEARTLGMTRQLGQAIGLLKLSNKELTALLEFHAALNPYLLVVSDQFEPVSVCRQTREPMRNKEGATRQVPRRGGVCSSVVSRGVVPG